MKGQRKAKKMTKKESREFFADQVQKRAKMLMHDKKFLRTIDEEMEDYNTPEELEKYAKGEAMKHSRRETNVWKAKIEQRANKRRKQNLNGETNNS